MAGRDDESAEDEEGNIVHKDLVSPSSDVFSYFTMAMPSERKVHGRVTVDAVTSYLLVFLVLFFQGVLLFCVSDKVIRKNLDWQMGVMNTGKDWNIYGGKTTGCSDGKSLCSLQNGTYTCSPPSIQLIGRWDELDVDGDGAWTHDELIKSREALKCKYAVDPVEVFDVMISLLKEREKHIWLHPDVSSGKAIKKVYFTYIMGDIAMCGYRNADMCGNLLHRGFFDAALLHGTAPRVGTTIRSALAYCHDLLDEGGFCERSLPSTYSTWKIESVQECGNPEFSQFVHKDPNSGDFKSMLQVDYSARIRYETAQTLYFKTYKTIIIFLWILLIVAQSREVGRVLGWAFQIPSESAESARMEATRSEHAAKLERHRSEFRNDESHRIGLPHRIALITVNILRLCMLALLLYVGLNFLGRSLGYIGLLMDGVALIFIVEVEEIVYARVLRREVRVRWEERDPIELKKMGLSFLVGRPDITDLMWLLLVCIMAIGFLAYYTSYIVNPLEDALECACLSRGERCQEAHTFGPSFWDQYWKNDVPSSISAINELKGSGGASGPGFHAMESSENWNQVRASFHAMPVDGWQRTGGRVAANLLQSHLRG